MLPCTTELFSSGVPRMRLLEAKFGRSDRTTVMMKRPLASTIMEPFGSAISESLPHHFAKMSQRSTFRHGAVAEGGTTTLVSTWEKGAARQALAAEWGELV